MKINNLLSGLTLAALIGSGLASCSNDIKTNVGTDALKLQKAPEAKAYAGNQKDDPFKRVTRSSNTEANRWFEQWDCPPTEANDLSPQELEELKALLSFGHEVSNETIFPFENYWIQQIYKGEDEYTPTDKFGDDCNQKILGSGNMDRMAALGNWGDEQVANFNYGNNNNNPGNCQNCGRSLAGTTLQLDMKDTGSLDANSQFGFWESFGSDFYNNYFIVEYKGYYYLGFDYEMHKDANNPGEVKDVNRDWNFTDWIVRIVPAYPKGETPADNPGGVTTPVNPDPETPEKPDPETPEVNIPDIIDPGFNVDPETPEVNIPDVLDPGFNVDPETPEIPAVKGEVEVNLAADEKEDGSFDSHLSIHVRTATDVEIFIPVPKQYYCEADDMEIVMKHEPNHMGHGGPSEFTWTLKDSDLQVSLYVQYEEDGIRIWTDGITQEVIDWCWEKCQDGITFEVWNYFNEELDLDLLKEYLNQATIKFLDKEPDYYVNAFTEENGQRNENDCKVSIVKEQRNDYGDPKGGEHLNGSTKNVIYENKNLQNQE